MNIFILKDPNSDLCPILLEGSALEDLIMDWGLEEDELEMYRGKYLLGSEVLDEYDEISEYLDWDKNSQEYFNSVNSFRPDLELVSEYTNICIFEDSVECFSDYEDMESWKICVMQILNTSPDILYGHQ